MRLIAENLGGERGGEAVFSGVDFALAEGEALTQGMAAKAEEFQKAGGRLYVPLHPVD